MQKVLMTFLLCSILTQSFSQTQRKSSLYLQGQFNLTLNDVTKGNNSLGMGVGLQIFAPNTSKLRPTIDFTADAYIYDDKVYRMYLDGTPIRTVDVLVNLFAGASYHPTRIGYLSFVCGPGFVSGQTLFGVKPSLGFYFTPDQKFTGKISYINVFNREPRARENFTLISCSLGIRLY